MKKILLISLSTILVAALWSCEDKLEEKYYNPEKTTQPSIEKFFTAMLNNDRVRPSYWDLRTFVVMHTGIYTQSVAFLNNTTRYQQNASYSTGRWEDYYRPGGNGGGVMAHYRSIESAYSSLSDADKANAEIFLQAAKVFLMDQTSQMVDLWGDIPYSQAGSLDLNGSITMPKFDDAKEVYSSILSNLKDASAYFATAKLSTISEATFKKQDILLSGNIGLWRRYTNSLRLRLLMRISFADETRAKTEILEMLNDPAGYPLLDDGAYNPATDDILLRPLTTYTNDLRSALSELTNYSAPGYLLDNVLKPANDPRIPVLFDKYGETANNVFKPNADYKGMPPTLNAASQQQDLGKYAIFDSTTFLYNTKLPGIVFTTAEVNFLKAEAYERWGGGDPKTAYETAIRQSITFYYYLNSLNPNPKASLTPPSSSQVDAFLAGSPTVTYTGSQEEKLGKIWTQKWVHYGFMQSVQSWAELRRTDYPKLSFTPDATTNGYELPPSRLIYPTSETIYNYVNYGEIKAKDLRDAKIFWDVK